MDECHDPTITESIITGYSLSTLTDLGSGTTDACDEDDADPLICIMQEIVYAITDD